MTIWKWTRLTKSMQTLGPHHPWGTVPLPLRWPRPLLLNVQMQCHRRHPTRVILLISIMSQGYDVIHHTRYPPGLQNGVVRRPKSAASEISQANSSLNSSFDSIGDLPPSRVASNPMGGGDPGRQKRRVRESYMVSRIQFDKSIKNSKEKFCGFQ